ncbi:MAG: UDP-2,3-diacylglucosamine hydrolase [Candidatus Atribacteria bacterium]|nr:UDP-2,3-diacylglucosamine hydrolase [Candidatus Atribacteria bacterium]
MINKEKLLLIGGEGSLPYLVWERALERDYQVFSIGFSFLRPFPIDFWSEKLDSFSLSEIGKIAHKWGVGKVCLVGKIPKKYLFNQQLTKPRELDLLSGSQDLKDKPLLEKIFYWLQQQGWEIVSPLTFLGDFLTPARVITRSSPTADQWQDIVYGWHLARFLSDQEVGQTVVVKGQSVIAVEAAEGTDETIQRGIKLAQGKVVVVKAARSRQDYLIDIPGVGPKTVELFREAGGSVLALEAEKTLLIEPEKVQRLADQLGVSILGIKQSDLIP